MKRCLFRTRTMRRPLLYVAGLASIAALSGCVAYPAGPSPILSRLPATSPGAAPSHPKQLTQAEKQRYDRIDKQVLRDQQREMDAESTAQAWASYAPVAPVTVYGGDFYGSGYPYYGGYPAYYGSYPAYYGGYYGPGW